MSLNKLINYNDYKEIEKYCVTRLGHIVLESGNETLKENLMFLRGQYKAFLYLKKANSKLYEKKAIIYKYELYSAVKIQKNNVSYTYDSRVDYLKGIVAGLYECLNYLSEST